MGFIPLLVYVLDFNFPGDLFWWSTAFTSLAFIVIGFLKTYVTSTSVLKGIAETLGLGLAAAGLAYWVGAFLQQLLS
jgi:vacuolar iron transporter family protein